LSKKAHDRVFSGEQIFGTMLLKERVFGATTSGEGQDGSNQLD
jgi:hypothetical protein